MKTFELEIIDLNEDGDGVGKKNGFTWFVPGVLPGDHVLCHAVKVLKSFGRAEMLRLIEPSPHRVKAPCPYFEDCGGCQIQDFDYIEQLRLKHQWVVNALERIGGVEAPEVRMTIGMKTPYRFRNKGSYAVKEDKKGIHIGFYKRHTHDIVDVEDCLIQDEGHAPIIKAFKAYMRAFQVPAYNPHQKTGLIRHLVIRQSADTGEVMVTIVTYKKKFPMTQKMVELLLEANPKIVSVVQNIQTEKTSEILGPENKMLYGVEAISDQIGDLRFQISPLSFYQVNDIQSKRLYELAMEAAGLTGEEVVFDLYSGTGTLSLFLAQKAKKVYGVEMSASAVKDAERNAEINGMSHAEFILGRSEIVAPRLYSEGVRADVIVVDPPRSGCEPEVIESLLDLAPNRIVYVSCKPSTLARDVKKLCADGKYAMKWAQPVDMFGHSTNVEVVVKLERR